MSNTIKLKRGTSTPSTSDISNGEVAIDTSAKKLYINDSGTVKEIGGSGTIGGASGLDFNDDVKVRFGTGNDLEIYHNALNSYVVNSTGWLVLGNGGSGTVIKGAADENAVACTVNGAVEIYYDGTKKFETLSTGAQVTGDFNASNDVTFNGANYNAKWLRAEDTLTFYDNAKAGFGNNHDLKIYHDGSNTYLDNDTGGVRLNTASDEIQINKGTSEYMGRFITDGAVELYYDGTKKLSTTGNGIDIETGLYLMAGSNINFKNSWNSNLTSIRNQGANAANEGNMEFKTGADTLALTLDKDQNATFTGDINVADSKKLLVGTGNDLSIYHDGSDNYIDGNSAAEDHLYIRANVGADYSSNIYLQAKSGENSIVCRDDESAELYYDNTKRFETTAGGTIVTGTLGTTGTITGGGHIKTGSDSGYFLAGASNDLQIYHSGTNSVIDNNTGGLYIRNNVAADVGGDIFIQAKSGEDSAKFTHDGSVELRYDNVKKFETTSAGVIITGNAVASSKFRGNDDVKLSLGDGEDLEIYHNGTRNYIDSKGTQLRIETDELRFRSDGGDTYAQANANGAFEAHYDNVKKFETTSVGVQATGHIFSTTKFRGNDDVKVSLGTSEDLQIYHDGSNSHISDEGTGSLLIKGDAVNLGTTGGEYYFRGFEGGAVYLRYDNSTKLETTSAGTSVTGTLTTEHTSGNVGYTLHANGNSLGSQIKCHNDHGVAYVGQAGDTTGNLLIWNESNTNIKIATNNAERLTVTSAGLVGINRTDPKALLDVGGNIYITSKTSNANEGGGLLFQAKSEPFNTTSCAAIKGLRTNDTSSYLVFETGGTTERLRITSDGNVQIGNDSGALQFGTGQDLEIYHNGTDSFVKTWTGDLWLQSTADDIIIRAADNIVLQPQAGENGINVNGNGSVELYYDDSKKLETTSNGISVTGSVIPTGNVNLGDSTNSNNNRFIAGASDDLQIYHSGDWNYIQNHNNKNFVIQVKDNENAIVALPDSSVKIYHNNIETLTTTDNGIVVYGTEDGNAFVYMYADEGDDNADKYRLSSLTNGNWEVQNYSSGSAWETNIRATGGGLVSLYYDDAVKLETTSGGIEVTGGINLSTNLSLVDNGLLKLGTGDDLSIYHDGTDSTIKNNEGDLRLKSNTDSTAIRLQHNTENMLVANADGAVELYYDNSLRLSTASGGVSFTNGHLSGGDNNYLILGAGNDLQIWHDGSFSYIKDTNASSALIIEATNDTFIKHGGETCARFNNDGSVELYYDNERVFNTEGDGVKISNTDGDAVVQIVGSEGNESRILMQADDGDDNADKWNLVAHADGYFAIQNFESGSWAASLYGVSGGRTELAYDGVKKFETQTGGVLVTGTLKINDGSSSDNRIALGDSGDLLAFHDGSNTYIRQEGTGWLYLDVQSGKGTFCNTDSTESTNLTLKKTDSGADGIDYFQCRNSSNHLKLVIEGDGDVKNSNNNYLQISDVKLKENIVDANSQWDDIKAIKIRNWNFKASTGFDTHTQIGLVAQELETICPNLVKESIDRDPDTDADLGTKTKSVKTSILYMKAVKALQEAMARIETLETKVAALESA